MSAGTGVLDRLAGGLIVSCQPIIGGPMDTPEIVTAMALAALDGGAAGLRIEGLRNLLAVRAAASCPIIGLVKRSNPGSDIYITPLTEDVAAVAGAGADIVAFDGTARARPTPVAELAEAAHAAGVLAMADLAAAAEGRTALAAGVDILGTTLSGYVGGLVPEAPDTELVSAFAATGAPVFAEGRYRTPADARLARDAGAHAVVVGSAITRIEHITGWFVAALQNRGG